MEMARFNIAKIIILDNEFCKIVIDKEKHSIIHVRQCDKEINENVTEMCEQMEKEYTIDSMAAEAHYKGGVVMSKLLNSHIDKQCISFIDNFNVKLIKYNEVL